MVSTVTAAEGLSWLAPAEKIAPDLIRRSWGTPGGESVPTPRYPSATVGSPAYEFGPPMPSPPAPILVRPPGPTKGQLRVRPVATPIAASGVFSVTEPFQK